VVFSWSYFDPNGNPQSSFRIQVDDNSDFSSPVINTIQSSSASSFTSPAGVLFLGKTYYWRVAVEDSTGEWSNWSNVAQFTTPSNCFQPDFTLYSSNAIYVTLVSGGPAKTSNTTNISAIPINGFSGTIGPLTAASDITGASYKFSPANTFSCPGGSCSSVSFSVIVPSTTTSGPHTIVVKDSITGNSVNIILNVEVFNPGWIEF
jgi:hypothetical protein